jgi:hypothetical protein
MKKDEAAESVLNGVDPQKREFLGRLIRKTAFAAPVIASFAMTGLIVADTAAANGINPSPS